LNRMTVYPVRLVVNIDDDNPRSPRGRPAV
jgi:hypothetical protein